MSWTCTVCKRPIADSEGGLQVDDTHLPIVEFRAVHDDCDPVPDSEVYWIDVHRAPTLDSWCSWVHHVGEKTWLQKDDVLRMVEFWFKNRGISIYNVKG